MTSRAGFVGPPLPPPGYRPAPSRTAPSNYMIKAESNKELCSALDSIKPPGSFASFKAISSMNVDLYVNDVGSIRMPLEEAQAQQIIAKARQAPYGRGEDTVVDTSVRNTWELDANQFELRGSRWNELLKTTLQDVGESLGIYSPIKAELYKMFLYEKGAMFKSHTDSPKIPNMFGTLVLILPSAHSGGAVVLRHNGKEVAFKSSEIFQGFMSWYSDVHHEVLPVTSGYRWVLTYNLALVDPSQERPSAELTQSTSHLRQALQKWMATNNSTTICPIYKLDHNYASATLSLASLKRRDKILVEALKEISKDRTFHVLLATLEERVEGSCEEYGYDYNPHADSDDTDDDSDDGMDVDGFNEIEELYSVENYIHVLVDLDGIQLATDRHLDLNAVISKFDFEDGRVKQIDFEEGFSGNEDKLFFWEAMRSKMAGFDMEFCQWIVIKVICKEMSFDDVKEFVSLEYGVQSLFHLSQSLKIISSVTQLAGDEESTEVLRQWALAALNRLTSNLHPRILDSEAGSRLASCCASWYSIDDIQSKYVLYISTKNHKRCGESDSRDHRRKEADEFITRVVPAVQKETLKIPFHRSFMEVAAQKCTTDCDSKDAWQTVFDSLADTLVSSINAANLSHSGVAAPSMPRETGPRFRRRNQFDHRSSRDAYRLKQDALTSAVGSDDLISLYKDLLPLSRNKELVNKFVENINKSASRIDSKEYLPLWVPFLQKLLPVMVSNEVSLETPLYEELFRQILSGFVVKYVGPSTGRRNVYQPTVDCDCHDCRALNVLLRSRTMKTMRFSVSKPRRFHLHQQIDNNRVNCSHVTERYGRPETLIVTKNYATQDEKDQAWKTRCLEAKQAFAVFPDQKLREVLGVHYQRIVNMEDVIPGQTDNAPAHRTVGTPATPFTAPAGPSNVTELPLLLSPRKGHKRKAEGSVEVIDLTGSD